MIRVDVYASAFINSGNSVKSYTEKIIHEFYHVTEEGTQKYKKWYTTPRNARENVYEKRPHEHSAIQFASKVIQEYEE